MKLVKSGDCGLTADPWYVNKLNAC